MTKIYIKPLSVNECWKGKRYKTESYKKYEKLLKLAIPYESVPQGKLRVEYEFGFSSAASDWDNPIKPLQDILQKRLGFDDKMIFESSTKKVIVPKGEEYIKFEIFKIN